MYTYCESTVPRIRVIITRKAYSSTYVVMKLKSIGADLAYAWPTAELAVVGPRGGGDTAVSCNKRPTPSPGRPSSSTSTPAGAPTRTPRPSGAASTTS